MSDYTDTYLTMLELETAGLVSKLETEGDIPLKRVIRPDGQIGVGPAVRLTPDQLEELLRLNALDEDDDNEPGMCVTQFSCQ